MKQVLQSIRTGEVRVIEVPPPRVRPNGVLVRSAASVISPGTEGAALEFGRMSLAGKARTRPDLVRQVLDKVRREGVVEAARVVRGRLDRPVPVGYACAGTVIGAGAEAPEFRVGDRVACAGAGYANHAEVNYLPKNLVVPIPRTAGGDWLSFEEASFASLGAIALHAVRCGRPGLGDRVAVIGLGLIGLLVAQILRAHGCRVLGIDPLAPRCALAARLGLEAVASPETAAARTGTFTGGIGADLVVIAAAAKDSGPVELAGEIARDRARVVALGATGLELPRRTYYRKELSLVVSRSYGPGRYDPEFEERGHDYPVGYVRWTERENLGAFLDLVADGRVQVGPLISHRIPIDAGEQAYELLGDGDAIGIVVEYPRALPGEGGEVATLAASRIDVRCARPAPLPGAVGISVLGAGAHAHDVLLPVLARLPGVTLRGIVTGGGLSARTAADRFGFRFCATEADAIWQDAGTHAVIIATRNDLHAGLVAQAIAARRAVFVEKPLCLSEAEAAHLVAVHAEARSSGWSQPVMVGFNRRFAPSVLAVRAFVASLAPTVSLGYRVNAGPLPVGSWVGDPAEGGGRLLSEVCHFVDLAGFLVGAPVQSVFAQGLPAAGADVVATLTFRNGSIAALGFYGGGDRSYSKERIELFGGGAVAVIDDFHRAWLVRDGRRHRLGDRWGRPQKGHREGLAAFVEAVRAGSPGPVPFAEAVASTRVTFAIRESLGRGMPIDLGD